MPILVVLASVDEKFTVFSDWPVYTAPGHLGSIPPELCVTTLNPDIVIIDNQKQTIHLFELTYPAERNIDTRYTEKTNKYSHNPSDITHLKCKVSSKGFINTRNHSTLH